MSFKPIDAKRDDFRKYLERTGVLEAISKVFMKLIHCQDKPENAIDFICANLGSTLHQNDQIESLQKDLEESKDEIAQLKQIIENLKSEKKFSTVNEQSTQHHQQEIISEINNQNPLSDNENVENQMADIKLTDTPSNLSDIVINNESSMNTSIQDSELTESISDDNIEKNAIVKAKEPKNDAAVDKIIDSELTNKTEVILQ